MANAELPAPRTAAGRDRRTWAGQWLLAVALALAAAVTVAGVVAGRQVPGKTEVVSGRSPTKASTAPPSAASPEAYYDLGGATPAASPASRFGVAFLSLDDPFERATGALGPPAATFPDIGGTASSWVLGDALLTVGAWGDGLTSSISSLYASVPEGSPVRVSAFGAVIGQSSLADVVGAWGPGYRAATSPYDDYVVSYVECAGPYPVVVKFDQAAVSEGAFTPGPGSALWARPVNSVFVAFADEPPSSSGCTEP